jgi:hypothetical protein
MLSIILSTASFSTYTPASLMHCCEDMLPVPCAARPLPVAVPLRRRVPTKRATAAPLPGSHSRPLPCPLHWGHGTTAGAE